MLCAALNSPLNLRAFAFVIVCLLAHAVNAQVIYRIVDENGRVTFTDVPNQPPTSQARSVSKTAVSSEKSSDATAATDGVQVGLVSAAQKLPPEVQLIVSQYPVKLFTGSNCEKCLFARDLLKARGTPFAETIILVAGDIDKATGNAGATTLPVLLIGTHMLKEYSAKDWNSYLDAAGYSKNSVLPSSYKNPPPVLWKTPAPLSSLPNASQTNKKPSPPSDPNAPYPVVTQPQLIELPSPTNPNGIIF